MNWEDLMGVIVNFRVCRYTKCHCYCYISNCQFNRRLSRLYHVSAYSIWAPLVTLQTSRRRYSSSHVLVLVWLVNVGHGLWNSLSKLFKELRHRRPSFVDFHLSAEAEVARNKVRRSRGSMNGSARHIAGNFLPFALHMPVPIDGDWSATRGT